MPSPADKLRDIFERNKTRKLLRKEEKKSSKPTIQFGKPITRPPVPKKGDIKMYKEGKYIMLPTTKPKYKWIPTNPEIEI